MLIYFSRIVSSLTFFIALLLIFLCGFVLIKNWKSRINFCFSLVCLSAATWLFSYSQAYSSLMKNTALNWFKMGYPGVVFISITYFHFANAVLRTKTAKWFIFGCYILGLLIAILIWRTNFIIDGIHVFSWGVYPRAGRFHVYFLAFFFALVNIASGQIGYVYLFKRNEIKSQIVLQQFKYILLAFIIFTFASIDFIPNYGIDIPPMGFIPVTIFLILIFYSIVRYRLMDIKVAITRAGIFLFVYTMVLGIPFGLGISILGRGVWLLPVSLMGILATGGPFIYLYIQRRAEEVLLQEQRQYQSTLRQASMGMGQIKDLKRLLQLIVHIVTRAVSIEHCKIFLMHEESKQLILKASRGRQSSDGEISVLALDCPLVSYLKEIKEPVVYEEIKQLIDDYNKNQSKKIEEDMRNIDGALVVPSFIDQKLIAILVLGKKKTGKLYTQDDLAVFSILANQAGLAIENAQFYERMKETHMQLIKAEKMATVGTMADGLSHQINNRLHAMGFIAGDALDTIRLKKGEKLTKEMKAFLDEIEHSLGRIEDNVKRGGEIVEGLLKYTRKGEEGFEIINLNKLLDASLEMVKFKIKLNEMDFVRSFNDNIPNIHGNFTQLQEVFFNIIDNAYDAMMQRKNEMKEPGYKARLEISADKRNQKLEILINDNGIGVKNENLEKLFTPFFTTKLSSKKGTGLGLYVIRQIIEENHGGRVRFTSQYKKGSQTNILLPIASEDRKES